MGAKTDSMYPSARVPNRPVSPADPLRLSPPSRYCQGVQQLPVPRPLLRHVVVVVASVVVVVACTVVVVEGGMVVVVSAGVVVVGGGVVVVGRRVVVVGAVDDVVLAGAWLVDSVPDVDVVAGEDGGPTSPGSMVVVGGGRVIEVVSPVSSGTVTGNGPNDVGVCGSVRTDGALPADGPSDSSPEDRELSAPTLADRTSGSTSPAPAPNQVTPASTTPTTATAKTATTEPEMRRPTTMLLRHEKSGSGGGELSESRCAICLASSSGVGCRRPRGWGNGGPFLPAARQAEVTPRKGPSQRPS